MTRHLHASLFALVCFLIPFRAHAQQQESDTALPTLTPKEVEIRGQLEIAFPSLDRQPLVGFNPPPRVQEIPEGRTPFIAAYKQEQADLPPSPLSRPEPPPVSDLAGNAVRNGSFETGIGRYLSRFVAAQAGVPLSPYETFYGHLAYDGSEGHHPFTNVEALQAPYNTLEGKIGLSTRRGRIVAGAELDGFFNTYTLFGARSTSLSSDTGDLDAVPERDGRDLGGAVWLRTQADLPVAFQLRLRYGGTRYETDIRQEEGLDDPRLTRTEQRLDAATDLSVPIGGASRQAILLDARLSTAGMDGVGAFESSTWLFDGGGGIRLRLGSTAEVTVGGRVMSFDAGGSSRASAAHGETTATYVAPDVRLDVYPAGGTRLYVQNRPGAEMNSLADVYRLNPYLVDEPDLQPSVRTLDAEGGASVFAGPLQLAARGGYRYYPNYLYFEDAPEHQPGGIFFRGFSNASYDEARIWYAGGDISVVLPGGLQALLGATYRKGQLSDDAVIPYFGPTVGQAMLSYAFLRRRGLVQVTGSYESGRFRDREESRRLGEYVDVDLAASFQLTQSLGVLARIENISSASRLERWDNYPQAPLVIQGGLRIQW